MVKGINLMARYYQLTAQIKIEYIDWGEEEDNQKLGVATATNTIVLTEEDVSLTDMDTLKFIIDRNLSNKLDAAVAEKIRYHYRTGQ